MADLDTVMGMTPDGSRAIQLALAPVFLLTSIAGILNVITGRLSRIVDRGRQLTEAAADSVKIEFDDRLTELRNLERRRRLAGVAITATTLAALLTCVVIVLLFVEVLLGVPMKWLEGLIFSLATTALVVGLTYFLREVHLATRTVRINPDSILPKDLEKPGPAIT
jgi:Flp pilus assembly protein TadB